MIILGLNAYHGDSSACLVIDGKIVNAIEEERIRRIKHWAGLPSKAVKWCLEDQNLKLSDVDFIAIARDPSSHLYKKLLMGLTTTSMTNFVKDRLSNVLKMTDIRSALARELDINLKQIKAKVIKVEHHMAHIASTFLVSPFDDAACISIDGFGDFLSTMRAIGKEDKIKVVDFVEYPHSLGIFYNALTQYLGFWNYGDEYKVMGLSAYGKPVYLDKMRKIVKLQNDGLFELDTTYFNHAELGVSMVWENGCPVVDKLFSSKLVDFLGSSRNKDDEITEHYMNVASSLQAIYEEAFFHVLNSFYEKTKLNSIALAGGCIQNSLANGKIYEKTKYRNVYIPPASYDAGLAIGSAMYVWHQVAKNKHKFVIDNPYLGPAFSKKDIQDEIKRNLSNKDYLHGFIINEEDLCKKVARFISEGKIIGWFQGRTEWGPRALGNRSIIVDPRKKEMKDILNERVKRREWFRPFAPSVLEDKMSEWFNGFAPAPFMEKVYLIKCEKQLLVPAVCHVDGTGRLQTVSSKINPRYYKLIQEFENLSGVPIVLNTSFNDNEPIVNSPKDAIQCFLNTKMDVLVLENFIISKNGN